MTQMLNEITFRIIHIQTKPKDLITLIKLQTLKKKQFIIIREDNNQVNMSFFTSTLLLILGTLLYTAVFTNGQVFLAPAGRHLCPKSGATLPNQPPFYPMKVIVALDQLTQDNGGNAIPTDSTPSPPRCRPEASRIFTKLFSLPGAVTDSLLSGEIMF